MQMKYSKFIKTIFSIIFLMVSYLHCYSQSESNGEIEEDQKENKKIIGFSLHSGLYIVNADIDGSGLGLGARINIPVNAMLSLRVNYFNSFSKGLSSQPWTHSSQGGGLIENEYEPYRDNVQGWFPSYKFRQSTIELEGLLNLAPLLNKTANFNLSGFDVYILGSYVFFGHRLDLDLLDESGKPYENLVSLSGWTIEKFNLDSGRKEIKNKLIGYYDGDYETQMNTAIRNKTYSYGAGLKYHVSPSFSIGLEYKNVNYKDFDYIDGVRFKNPSELSLDNDLANYMNIFIEGKL